MGHPDQHKALAASAAPVVDPKRAALLKILTAMPDEAFGWFVVFTQNGYPDGLGGFKPESRESITKLKAAGLHYMETQG